MENVTKNSPSPKNFKYLQDALYVIGGKWKLPVLHSLGNGNVKFRDIQRSIPNITSRMLVKELRELELNGFVSRNTCPESASYIHYEVTAYCKSFEKIIKEMIKWGKQHRVIIATNLVNIDQTGCRLSKI